MKTNSSLIACPKGHWTHSFLTCDLRSDCGIEHYILECPFGSTSPDAQSDTLSYSQNLQSAGTGDASFSMFMCEDGVSRVHYTLVCDWRHDCLDRSDETFCWHEPCEGFTCSNRQCVPNGKRCDNFANCLDESDEENCSGFTFELLTETFSTVDFTGQGGFTQTPMNGSEPCPDTHYRCGGQSKLCLPVYTRCNGYNDCLDGEDEVACDNVTCPGFYRCLDSSVCVHTLSLCDGWPQCPQHDDEWMCQEHHHCPSRCACQGHAFVCHEFFSVEQYPHLRYLEITGASVVDIAHLTNNTYLVYLALTNCSVTHLPGVALPNLQVLDLSDNLLTQVNVSVFLNLRNLQTLQLAGNPISQLVSTDIVNTASSSVLAHVDLSRSKLAEFDCGSVSQFQSIRGLNLSFSPVEKINDGGFSCLPSLQSLDVRGCPLGEYAAGLFEGLTQLSVIYASDYRLCCQHMLPKQLPNQPTCITASEDPVSSCENLLKHKTYQIVLIVCSILAVLANPVCVVVRYTRLKEPFRNVSGMLVTNLMMSNSLMGLYSAIVSGADELYRGHYVLFEKSWTRGVACKVAGHFFVMSTLVSTFSVLFLTLAGFFTRRFPRCTKLHFDCRSTLALCLAAWGIGFALAAIPLMPVFSQWEIHDQRGVCALPVLTNSQDSRFHYSFAIQTMYMILSVCGCAVQIFVLVIAKKDRAKSLLIQPSASMHGEANVVVVNCLCLAAHAASGLVMRFDAVSSAAVLSAIQFFSLPVPAALNPVLYTINRVREQRRREMEARLLQLLKLRARTQAKA